MFLQLQGQSAQSSFCFSARSGGDICVQRPTPDHASSLQHTHTHAHTSSPTPWGEEKLVLGKDAHHTVVMRALTFFYFLHKKMLKGKKKKSSMQFVSFTKLPVWKTTINNSFQKKSHNVSANTQMLQTMYRFPRAATIPENRKGHCMPELWYSSTNCKDENRENGSWL